MSGELDGAVALVTGASSGIGEATAIALAAGGASVAVVARRQDRLGRLASRIDGDGARALTIAADIADPEAAKSSVDETISVFGRLDIVVNNAGVMLLGPALDAPLAEWERMIGINVGGVVHVAHAALPHLVAAASSSPRGVADLVNISSVAGRVARSGSAVYNLTKFGVGGFSEGLRQELSPRHVRVSIVEPGAVATELVDHVRDGVREVVRQRFADIDRLQAEDIADLIRFIVTRPRHVAVNEVLIRPTEQAF